MSIHLTPIVIAFLYLVSSAISGWASGDEASNFVTHAESELEILGALSERAEFLNRTDETEEHTRISTEASRIARERRVILAKQAAHFAGRTLPDDVARKLGLMQLAITIPAPSNPERSKVLSETITKLQTNYTTAENCTDRPQCRTKDQLYRVMRESRDPEVLLSAWMEWRMPARAIRAPYAEMVAIANEGARELRFNDVGALWRSVYDMSPEAFLAEYRKMWDQVQPLYKALHCHVRAKLREYYGDIVPQHGLIPAHLLGTMWAENWSSIAGLVGPGGADRRINLTELLESKGFTPRDIVRTEESFFNSIGFSKLPRSFWERSMLEKPKGRKVNCHESAWEIESRQADVRMSMCIESNERDFFVVHHELGHIYYYLAYARQSYLFRSGANPGFHEAIGDAIGLSITPAYLKDIGLLDEPPSEAEDLPFLFRTALEKIPQLAMAIVVDLWRWGVFSGEIKPERYNESWWNLQRNYQGLAPPIARDESDFDAGMFYHISNNVPYDRYFVANILQFDFHRALCEAAGQRDPLHRCSIFGSRDAGKRLAEALTLGASRPWFDAMEKLTGRRVMDASSILKYFGPVAEWLEAENRERRCGW